MFNWTNLDTFRTGRFTDESQFNHHQSNSFEMPYTIAMEPTKGPDTVLFLLNLQIVLASRVLGLGARMPGK